MKYYLGLDMGTSSVGWAVTDEKYNLIRKKGKELWGVRLFSEAQTAAKRRSHRVSRRRLQREKARIGYLKELFEEQINQCDAGFFQRLEDSKYFETDKVVHQPFSLFADTGYTDQQYYQDYPTIFHLRNELLHSKEPHDVRLVFLAILNMYKHRGHFLNASLGENGTQDINVLCQSLSEKLSLVWEKTNLNDLNADGRLIQILSSKEYSSSRKHEKLLEELQLDKKADKKEAELLKLICGLTATIANIFVTESFEDENKKFKISFKDGNFDEKCGQVEAMLSPESYEVFLTLKEIYDASVLANIMQGEGKTYQYLSEARVDLYEKHQKDLIVLKRVYKKYAPEKYDAMFRTMEENNYSAYVGSVNSGRKQERRGAKAPDFFKNVEKAVGDMPEDEDTGYILQELEKDAFLPKQLTSANGVIPNQVHKAELKKILENAENYLPFLKETDETGLSVSEKIVQMFAFQIPYYVGPLRNNGQGNAWSVRKEAGRVFPWNFEQKIDTKESAERFISKMVKRCTYLTGENVLPKNSLLYEKFMVLNELNNLKINGEDVPVSLKQDIYNHLFKKGKKVTAKKLIEYLKKNAHVENQAEIEITGIDGDFTNTLSNYAKFTAVFNTETLTFEQEKMAENIIFWSTVYGDSKSFLKERIQETYGDVLSKEQIKRIMGYKFKDWGRLSKTFLEIAGTDTETGEVLSIMQRMWNENYNLMELLSHRFTYRDEIEKQASKIEKTLSEVEYEDLEDLYLSSPVKRMIWQTIKILKELEEILEEEPAKIFVEMARDVNAEKKRTDSRKKKFSELYRGCKDDGKNWSKEIADTEEYKFRSKKLYLYYTQKGRCMYTGDRIELSDLFNDNLYDLDHIYPRHFVKDDSLENNLVLVKKERNAHKSDNYPIEPSIRSTRHIWWKTLKDGKFITEEKYKRLMRNEEFTDDEKAAFISRQIVETRQGTKAITDLFEQTFHHSEIVYVKAGNVSAFRQKYDIVKCRNVNDYHHAHDAYLNIVVGNTYHVKFTKNPINFIREYRRDAKKNPYHMYKIFDYTVQRNGEVAWNTENNESIRIVKKALNTGRPLVTQMNYEEHGGIADQTIYSAKEAQSKNAEGYISVKASDSRLSDICKYGGYKKYTGSYFFLVEYTKKGKRVRSLEAMPLYRKEQLNTTEKMEEYCRTFLGYENPVIRLKKIKMYSLIKVDGFYLYLTGRGGASLLVTNAVELSLDYEQMSYVKAITGVSDKKMTEEQLEQSKDISRERNILLYNTLKEKHQRTIYKKRPNPVGDKLEEWKEAFKELSISNQIYVLLQILQLSQQTNTGADLRLIGGKNATGKATVGKVISGKSEFKLVNQSAAGLYQNEIDLLTI